MGREAEKTAQVEGRWRCRRRRARTTLGAAVAVCALAAPSGALADEFVSGPAGGPPTPMNTKGGSGTEGKLEFKIGILKITCKKAHSTGHAEALALLDTIKYSSCTAIQGPGSYGMKTAVKGPVQLEYLANGTVNGLAPIVFDVPGVRCRIEVPPFEEASSVSYSAETVSTNKVKQFPSGFQHKLRIENAVEYLRAVATGECAEKRDGNPTGVTSLTLQADIQGTLDDEAVNGNLEWNTGEAFEGWDLKENGSS